jgi:hypothetical protein
VATVFAEVDRNRVGAAELGQRGCPYGVRLVRLSGLANSSYMVDVNAEQGQGMFPFTRID